MSSIDAKVALKKKYISKNNWDSNYLIVKIYGKSINYVITNTIRRVIIELVPSYAFSDINIIKNTSIFNNDTMRLRLTTTPILNYPYTKDIIQINDDIINKVIDLEIETLTEKDVKRIDSKELDEKNKLRKLEIKNNLHMHINAKNNDTINNVLNVTTNDKYTTFMIKDNLIPSIYPNPVLIIKLNKNEEFIATCIASINIPLKDAMYSTCSHCSHSYEEKNPHEIDFELHSRRQISEEQILIFACKIIIKKIKNIQNKIIKLVSSNKDAKFEAEIIIDKENDTMGNLINRSLQDHPDIIFSGYKMSHPNINEINIRYKTNNINILDILNECINNLEKLFTTLIKEFEKL